MYSLYRKVTLADTNEIVGTGWLPQMPDLRDYSPEHPEIRTVSKKLGLKEKAPVLPVSVDLRKWCSPIENQLNLGSCTAYAGMELVE